MSEDTQDKVKEKIEKAINKLYERDAYLLENDVNERSITHKLACYIESEFDQWDVDCEYNRINGDTKVLIMLKEGNVSMDDTNAKTVFPDIIIHHRGGDNLLVIEVKKSSSSVPCNYDKKKLSLFKEQLKYRFAFFLKLGIKRVDCQLKPI